MLSMRIPGWLLDARPENPEPVRVTRTLGEAIAQGYVVVKNSVRLKNAFYYYCAESDEPFVHVLLKTKYASITVDLIGQSYRMGEVCQWEVLSLLRMFHAGHTRQGLWLSDTIMHAPRIPVEEAAWIARKIVVILFKPGYREPLLGSVAPEVQALDEALRTGTLAG